MKPTYIPKVCKYHDDEGNCTYMYKGEPSCIAIREGKHYICPVLGTEDRKILKDYIRESKRDIKRFNKALEKIPLRSRYSFKGIKFFMHIDRKAYLRDLEINSKEQWNKAKEEAKRLLDAGHEIAFSFEDIGIGTIRKIGKRYRLEYNMSTLTSVLDKCLERMKYLCNIGYHYEKVKDW